jgi:hypothetical protein
MKKILRYLLIVCFSVPFAAQAQFEQFRDSVVQLYGVVMTADSLQAIPRVTVQVKGRNQGTFTNDEGVFSIVVLKGDVIEFSHISFKPQIAMIPKELEGNQQSLIQLMVEDTSYLAATIIRPRPTREQFERDFLAMKVSDDDIETARKNTEAARLRLLARTLPADAGESVNYSLRSNSQKMYYRGQNPPMNIMNPFAWNEFIQSWKRGDFKKKK